MKRSEIPPEERDLLLDCECVAGVTRSKIYFTSALKESYYAKRLDGEMPTKIFKELGIPLTPSVLNRLGAIDSSIRRQVRLGKPFQRQTGHASGSAKAVAKTADELAMENAVLRQNLEFLKKISRTAGKTK